MSTIVRTHARCCRYAAGSSCRPIAALFAEAGITAVLPMTLSGSRASPACSTPSAVTAIRVRPSQMSRTMGIGASMSAISQTGTARAAKWISKASGAMIAAATNHHHHGTDSRSEKTSPARGRAEALCDGDTTGSLCSDTEFRVVSPDVRTDIPDPSGNGGEVAAPDSFGTSADPVLAVPIVRLDKGLPLPARAHHGDAGVDLHAAAEVTIGPGERVLVGTGVAVALPVGTVGLIHPRSGLAARTGLSIVNTPGTVDAGYRGEIKVCLINHDLRDAIHVRRGDRIAQLLVQRVELPDFVEVDSLDETSRGAGGYGSSGGHSSLGAAAQAASDA
jgi:dUTP pyrophosphatase